MKLNLGHLLIVFTLGVVLSSGILMQTASAANQPHMVNALEDLRAARHQLEIAEQDKGGHRAAAIPIVDNAIAEVKAGIAAGN
jgi:hypothetical protein